jgi:SAM-dependent methyltransferase
MARLHAVLPTYAKRIVWNIKYGLLRYPHWTAPQETVSFLSTRVSESVSILELGCGRGSLLRALRQEGWSGCYCGVDISKQAIRDARKLHDQRSSWIVSDIETFCSPFKWDVIAMIESVYYVNLSQIPATLARLISILKENGFLLVRLHDPEEHREYVNAIFRLFPHAERIAEGLFYITQANPCIL